jgi:hypothetical protein
MGAITREQQTWLQEKFGSRVTFDRLERKLYGHDIAAMPSLVRPLVGDTAPDGVVQPQTEAEWSAYSPQMGNCHMGQSGDDDMHGGMM